MKIQSKAILTGLIFSALTLPAYAVPMIDQNQPLQNAYMTAFSQTDLAQSFQQSMSNITGAGIFLQPGVGSSDTVTLSVWDALPNQAGVMLATGTSTGTSGSWVDVFWAPVSVVPNTTLYLVFTGNTTLGVTGTTYDSYPAGYVFSNAGFGPFPSYDFTFRTYYDNQINNPTPTPEPGTLLLMGTGIAGLALWSRKRFKRQG